MVAFRRLVICEIFVPSVSFSSIIQDSVCYLLAGSILVDLSNRKLTGEA